MTGFEVYQQYILIKTHFNNDSFDATKYNKPSAKLSTYDNRNDHKFFEYIATKLNDKEVKPFFISNMIIADQYIINMVDDLDESLDNFRDWKRRMSQLKYIFKKDCSAIKRFIDENNISFDDMIKPTSIKYPILMRLMMEKYIGLETYVILEKVLSFTKSYDKMYIDDHIYDEYALRTRKYKYYFKGISISDYKKILRDIFYTE